jgi:iron(III) transport system substrate-binding protein
MAKVKPTPAVLLLAVIVLLAVGAIPFLTDTPVSADPLIVYCAHDSVYSEKILRRFERETGIPVSIRFDTEATKSLGLVNLLIREKEQPRCDVFWNNQVLGTLDLKDEGLLLPYKGPGYERIPERYKDPDGSWAGFAARLRVLIVNTDRMPATKEAIDAAFAKDDLSSMAVAKPLYGTTRTHYSVLWNQWGAERLKSWDRDVRARGLRVSGGNAAVMQMVASGASHFGWTDTDDFYVARDRGDPVDMLPVQDDQGNTICIPNSVCIIRGAKHLPQAKQLVDYLLSEEAELALAGSNSRQIPLGPVDSSQLSSEVNRLRDWAAEGYDLNQLGKSRRDCLDWLKVEYLE